jgi:hypothetical protein
MSENKYRLPWKVVYWKDWNTGEIKVYNGKKTVENIIDCDGKVIVETDSGVYDPKEEVAEFIVSCVNEKYEDESCEINSK